MNTENSVRMGYRKELEQKKDGYEFRKKMT